MAEKHKSKYKKPENKKPTYRKDLKDYTLDDKDGGMNPKSTKEKQLNVLRKTDKAVQDDGKLFPTYNADDRLYKDLEDGDYDPKTAAKRLKKRQDDEEKEVADVLKDKIENLTREQKEQLVREYVRRKIVKVLYEQPTTETPPTEEEPTEPDAAAAEPTAPAPDLTATQPTDTPTPDVTATPEAPATAEPAAATTTPEAPAAETPAAEEPDAEQDPVAKEALAIERFSKFMKNESGNIGRIKAISKVLNSTFKEAESEDIMNFYKMLKVLSLKKLASLSGETQNKSTNK